MVYYCDLMEAQGNIFTTINTVEVNKLNYINRQVKHTESARKFIVHLEQLLTSWFKL